jgi:hypothetical protein
MFTQNILQKLILLKIQIPCLAPSTPHPHIEILLVLTQQLMPSSLSQYVLLAIVTIQQRNLEKYTT